MKNVGLWLGIVLCVLSVVGLVTAFQYEYYTEQGPGPGMLPRSLSLLLLALSLCFMRESVRKPVLFSDIFKWQALKKSGLILVYLIGFTVLLPYIGFVADTAMLLFLLLRQQFRWSAALAIAIGVAGSLFWFFAGFLQLPLPVNSFGW